MKRNTLLYPFALMAALFTLAGCNDEDSSGTSPMRQGNYAFVATIEGQNSDAASRTAVDENGSVSWIDTDALGVYAAHTENAKFTSTGSGASVSFTGNLSPSDETAEWAYYPYNADAVLNNGGLSFTLPSQYTYTGNSNAPMLGIKGMDGNFEFKHLCGLLRITLGGGMPADADRFVVTSMGDDAPAIAGTVTVADVTASNAIVALKTENDSHSITYHLDGLTVAEEFQHFFVPLPVGKYARLQISFYLKGKEEAEFTRAISNLDVRRAVMTSLPVLDWKTGAQFVLNAKTKEITREMLKKISKKSFDETTGQTTLAYVDVAQDKIPKLGEILLNSNLTNDFPEGFLGRIVDVAFNDNGSYDIRIEPVALDEAFDELYVNETINLYPQEETMARALISDSEGFYCFTKTLQAQEEDYLAKGTFTVGLKLTPMISISEVSTLAQFMLESKVELTGDLTIKKALEKEEEIPIGNSIKLPPVRIAEVIVITPSIQPYAVVTAEGKIEMITKVFYENRNMAVAEYRDGAWTTNTKPIKKDNKSPWNVQNSIHLEGNVLYGCGVDINGKFYGQDVLQFGIKANVGNRLYGELNLQTVNKDNLSVIATNGFLNSQYALNGEFYANARIFDKTIEAQPIEFEEIIWGDHMVAAFPTFTKLQIQKSARTRANNVATSISTQISGELLSKDAKIAIVLENTEKEIISTSETINYAGEMDEEETENLNASFGELEDNTYYVAYPNIESAIYQSIEENGKVALRHLAIEFNTTPERALREQLIQLYKDTNGDNWTNNKNWCSDYPIESWYGVENMGDGFYRISLRDNNLNGSITLFDNTLKELDIDQNKQVKTLILNGCESLETLFYDSRALEHLEVAGCKSLSLDRAAFHTETAIKYLDVSECVKIVTPTNWQANMPNIETLIMRKLPDLEELVPWIGNSLQTLDISDCTKLKKVGTINSARTLRNLNISRCSMLSSSVVNGIINGSSIEILKLDDYKNGAYNIVNSVISPSLIELSANNCDLKGNLVIRSATNLKKVDLQNNPEMPALSIEGAPVLADLNLEGSLGIKYAFVKETALVSLNLDNRTVLKTLHLINNPLLSSLAFAETSLTDLVIEKTALVSLSLDNQAALKTVCSINNPLLSSLNLAGTKSLTELSCFNNQLANLDVKGCDNLEVLECSNNELGNTFDLHNLAKLNRLSCDNNKLSVLNLEGCCNLAQVACGQNNLTGLNVKGCTALQYLDCNSNCISKISLDDCQHLTSFNCNSNQLKALDINHCISLEYLNCGANQLTTLNVEKCVNLQELSCFDNYIEELDVLRCPSLSGLSCGGNKIKVLDLHGLAFLKSLSCSNNPITVLNINRTGITMIPNENWNTLPLESLDVSNTVIPSLSCPNSTLKQLKIRGCSQLNKLSVSGTQLTSLDISDCGNLTYLRCSDNPSLAKLIMSEDKNSQLHSLYANNTQITSEIYNWLEPMDFYYEQRYEYYKVEVDGNNVTKYRDKGYGWWYPAEPSSGKHSR